MNIIVAIKQVPDLVEELEINEEGTGLDPDMLSFVLNEFDDQALETALLLKEDAGATITVISMDTTGELDQALYTAIAKGADRAVKLVGDFDEGDRIPTQIMARTLANAIKEMDYDLVLTGVQAADDLDGQTAPLLAALLGVPHISVVTGVHKSNGTLTVQKEFWGGITAEYEVDIPAVIGVQAARQAPRYAPVSRVRQAMKEATIEEIEVDDLPKAPQAEIRRMYIPEATGRAEMLDGDEGEIAEKIVEILKERGLV